MDIINIRGKDGLSVWPEKNSEEDIDLFLSLVSAAAAQKEFFNNPVVDGGVFAEITYGKVPALSRFKFLYFKQPSTPGDAIVLEGGRDGKADGLIRPAFVCDNEVCVQRI